MTILCDYCKQPARLVGSETIYPHRPDLHHLRFWQCAPCDAYVGCHTETTQPFGRLANRELRLAKMAAHAAFDPLWNRRPQRMTRSAAYAWLRKQLGISRESCHIGMFDVGQCRRVVEICTTTTKGDH